MTKKGKLSLPHTRRRKPQFQAIPLSRMSVILMTAILEFYSVKAQRLEKGLRNVSRGLGVGGVSVWIHGVHEGRGGAEC